MASTSSPSRVNLVSTKPRTFISNISFHSFIAYRKLNHKIKADGVQKLQYAPLTTVGEFQFSLFANVFLFKFSHGV